MDKRAEPFPEDSGVEGEGGDVARAPELRHTEKKREKRETERPLRIPHGNDNRADKVIDPFSFPVSPKPGE